MSVRLIVLGTIISPHCLHRVNAASNAQWTSGSADNNRRLRRRVRFFSPFFINHAFGVMIGSVAQDPFRDHITSGGRRNTSLGFSPGFYLSPRGLSSTSPNIINLNVPLNATKRPTSARTLSNLDQREGTLLQSFVCLARPATAGPVR